MNPNTGNTDIVAMACPLKPVKSNADRPMPHPQKATFEHATISAAQLKRRSHRSATPHARLTRNQIAIVSVAAKITAGSPKSLTVCQLILVSR
jgi:hypothetical protein